ncbi:hypothetical protein J2Y45_003547 [Dyadobacter sp. BE34]|uniref:Uncharacterized protein n=1 Tax=Dyadobacter fermentans TaxID=94254 RepID=A0ABU1QZ16_9BACT|nr:hypothetical protein [Dyadobacter fermentans]MDR7044096.1 hypothetical protein [Dyadobacter sp. BE242]MDR7198407.1 hypothetical protein [Dyadobacter sp. BE34]MDR7216369.1 hypothetical protein [Dyadobacter sp. BE31]MDR7264104.1 hypothetical protein [Dyadobacter sp. BE32]
MLITKNQITVYQQIREAGKSPASLINRPIEKMIPIMPGLLRPSDP